MKPRILIVEDDNDINKLLCDMLTIQGYIVQPVYSGTEALLYIKSETWHMILLDLMLPGKTGEEVIKETRKEKNMPILIISAKDTQKTKVELLRVGADDFITKPFDIEEVLARIESNLRRYLEFGIAVNSNENKFIFEEILLDRETREVRVNGNSINLTGREFNILALLIKYPKKAFSKSNLFESVWGDEYLGDDNTINVHISNIRGKLLKAGAKQDYIQTIWGIGYKLET